MMAQGVGCCCLDNTTTLPQAEEWRPVSGWDLQYEVSNLGRVRRISTRSGKPWLHILRPGLMGKYKGVMLRNRGNDKQRYVHHLVAEAFLGERPIGCEINHIDTNKDNNAAKNLEYITHLQNVRHSWNIHPRNMAGQNHPSSKLTNEDVLEIRRLAGLVDRGTLAKKFGVDRSHICKVQNGQKWTHLGSRL